MKKIFLMCSMIAVLFSFTACSDGQETVNFEYNDNDIIFSSIMWADTFQNIDDRNRAYIENEGTEVYKTGLSNFDTIRQECGDFRGYHVKDENGDVGSDTISIDINSLNTDEDAESKIYDFLGKIYSDVEESGENVVVTLEADYEKRAVELRFVYEEDPSSAYNEGSAAYKLAEITTTPAYTTKEKMVKAGQNTLMGMGTVFIVLIFISLIIAQFERVNRFVEKLGRSSEGEDEDKPAEKEAVTVSSVESAVAGTDPMQDPQLVAVITAAVIAAGAAAGGSDRLVVRSIKKAKR
ncbi:MAG: OadG family protein [Lachnospiraceae bacterium]|nr:OadG family protein [Lachnospiraceae bacterium]